MSIFSGFESSRNGRSGSGHLNNSTENVVEGCPDINMEVPEVRKKSKKSKEACQKCNYKIMDVVRKT